MLSIQELTEKNKIIPVVKIKNIRQAVPLAKALYEGGIGCMEITFRTPDAAQAIRQVADEAAYMLVGAGTVTTKEQAEAAADAGARFIVSPGFSEKVASFCKEKDILYLPGCVTPTEIMKAMEYGIQTVKFFPAQIYGGEKAIEALSAPFGNITFVPTGGIHLDSLKEYLRNPKILACGGSWMVKEKYLETEDFDSIRKEAKKASDTAKEVCG